MSVLEALQKWYRSRCDGGWEHGLGVEIQTLDNPGWSVSIDLQGTELEGQSFSEIEDLEPEENWVSCRVVEDKFEGRGGAMMLGSILQTFIDWTESIQRTDAPD